MKNNVKKLNKQLEALEKRVSPVNHNRQAVRGHLSDAERDSILPGERIVWDYYENAKGETKIIQERITFDPSDKGKDFPQSAWDPKILDALFRGCQYKRIAWTLKRPNPEEDEKQRAAAAVKYEAEKQARDKQAALENAAFQAEFDEL